MRIVAEIVVRVYEDETVQVTGPVHAKKWCMKALDVAKETVKNYRGVITPMIVLPHEDVDKELIKA
jgi:hypothetical protein